MRGFALVAVMWLLLVVSGAVFTGAARARAGTLASGNRMAMARGRWAAEACSAIARQRGSQAQYHDSSGINLGRDVRCAWQFINESSRLHLGIAPRSVIARFLVEGGVAPDSAAVLCDTIMSLRAAGELADARAVPGFPERLLPYVTTTGSGLVDLLAASPPVLRALPGLGPEAVMYLERRREAWPRLANIHELIAGLSPGARQELLASFAALAPMVVLGTNRWTLRVTGWLEGHPARTTIDLDVVGVEDGLGVLGRRLL